MHSSSPNSPAIATAAALSSREDVIVMGHHSGGGGGGGGGGSGDVHFHHQQQHPDDVSQRDSFSAGSATSSCDPQLPFPGFVAISMGYLDQESPLRNYCLRMITNPWFERVSIMVILLNCVTLGMYQPCVDDEQCTNNRCMLLQTMDDVIFAFFAVEMLIKMIAMGVYGKGTYLADSWNRLDCFIVVAGAIEYCLDMEGMNLSAIRTIRVLRPLRAINRIPSMRILVMLLLDTLPMLGNVLLLCFFVFFIFGIVGVQLWSGTLRQRCFLEIDENINVSEPLASYYSYQDTERDYICSLDKDNGMHRCGHALPPSRFDKHDCNGTAVVGSPNTPTAESCVNWNQYYSKCEPGEINPFQGAISFDNIGLAWVAIFLVISLEGWTDIMYYVQDAHSFWDWIYFVLLIVIGSFFMINLCLVVIATQFSETKKREMERMRLERARYQSTSTLASTTTSEPATCYAQIVKYIAHLWRRAKRRWVRYWRQRRVKAQTAKKVRNMSTKTFTLTRKTRRKSGVVDAPCSGGFVAVTDVQNNNNNNINNNSELLPAEHVEDTCLSQVLVNADNNSSSSSTSSQKHNKDNSELSAMSLSLSLAVSIANAPRASPEVSDIFDPIICSPGPRKPAILLRVADDNSDDAVNPGGMLVVSNDGNNRATGGGGSMNYLQPMTSQQQQQQQQQNQQRRRSSVMFSDVVLMHGVDGGSSSEALNVCSRERMTQTDDVVVLMPNNNNNNSTTTTTANNIAIEKNEQRRRKLMLDYSPLSSPPPPTTTITNVSQQQKPNQSRPRSFSFAFFHRPSSNANVGRRLPPSQLTCPEFLALSSALQATLPANLVTNVLASSANGSRSDVAQADNKETAIISRQVTDDNTEGESDDWADEMEFWATDDVSATGGGDAGDYFYNATTTTDDNLDVDDDLELERKRSSKRKHRRRRKSKANNSGPPSLLCTFLTKCRGLIKKLVEHKYFQQGILLAILINTLSMGIEYHEQPKELTTFVETSNIVFSAIFAVEMLLKLIAEGIFGYMSNGFNVFDGTIVILSVLELWQGLLSSPPADQTQPQATAGTHGTSSLSVLRTFRLLRILKLVRFLPNLRRQLFVMLRTMDNVAVFFALLVLFIFIFSILGMNLFGCKFCSEAPDGTSTCDRKNFDTLLWAIVTVFQILTQEDWNVVLFNGMEKTTHWAAFYFVALMTFGNYVLFNLLVAILVEGFSAERNERLEREQRDLARKQRELAKQEALEAARQSANQDDSKPDGGGGEHPESSSAAGGAAGHDAELLQPVLSSTPPHHPLSTTTAATAEDDRKRDRGDWYDGDGSNVESTPISRRKQSLPHWSLSYGYDDEGEPKCNIEKETKMLQQPGLKVPNTSGELPLCIPPPIITHTAATPQGSPHATLDAASLRSGAVDWAGTRLSPAAAALYASCGSSIDSIDKSTTSLASIPSLQRSLSAKSTTNSVGFPARRSSLSPSFAANGNANLLGRKDSLSPGHSPGTTPSLRRRRSGSFKKYSWRGVRNSFRQHKSDKEGDNAGSGSEPDGDEDPILNNGRSARIEHLHCNGGVGTARRDDDTPNNKRAMSMSASRSPKTLSPQNSIKSNGSSPRSPLALAFAQLPWSPSPSPTTAPTIRNPVSRESSLRQQQSSVSSRNNSVKEFRAAASSPSPSPSIHQQQQPFVVKPNNLVVQASLGSAASGGGSTIGSVSPSPLPCRTLPPTNGVKEEAPKGMHFLEILRTPPECLSDREEYSLYIFSPDNNFRHLCTWVVNRPWFDHIVLLFIALNCITLAMERPRIPPDSIERIFLSASNYIFTAVFALEMLIKVIATGMFYGPEAYFTSGWNIMDGSLVTISIIDFLMSLISAGSPRIFGILRVFRLLRSLRPLRVINRAPGLKLVVQTLLSSLRPIGNIVLICCTFFIIFGILGVQLFKGTFFYCEGPEIQNVKTKADCLNDVRNKWVNRKYNFDDLVQALMALFVLSSKDGWVNIMYSGLDAVGVDMQPQENFSEWRLFYFISFLLLVGFFVLNMFVGVVVENFHRCREAQEREEKARRAAKRAKKMAKKRRKMHEPPYYMNYSSPRLFLHSMVTSKYFDLAIAGVIGLNVITMALEFYRMPQELEYTLKIFNYFFTAVFILELAMKLIALGGKRYLKDKWNQLDVVIVILSVVGIVLEEMKSGIIPINPTIIRVMRVMRIARVLKLLKMAKGIRALLDTVMQALPQVGNLGLLFFLLFFIFAALGVELFGRLECSEEYPCQGLSEHAHFGNFGIAFLTLFRVATGDNWNGIMKDTLRDHCDSSADCVRNCCVSPVIAPIFFVVFVLMAQFVLVNVVVAVLMKHLEESHKQMEDELDMEAELEQELAAEEALAELQEQLQVVKAIEAAVAVGELDSAELLLHHNPHHHHQQPLAQFVVGGPDAQQQQQQQKRKLGKMNSLPADFTFPSTCKGATAAAAVNGDGSSGNGGGAAPPERLEDLPAAMYAGSSHGLLTVATSPPVTMQPTAVVIDPNVFIRTSTNTGTATAPRNSINIRQPSPDEIADKVAVADLRTTPLIMRRSTASSASHSNESPIPPADVTIPVVRVAPATGSLPRLETSEDRTIHSLPGSRVRLLHRLTASELDLPLLLVPGSAGATIPVSSPSSCASDEPSPDCTSAAVTLIPPEYPVSTGSPLSSPTLPLYSDCVTSTPDDVDDDELAGEGPEGGEPGISEGERTASDNNAVT